MKDYHGITFDSDGVICHTDVYHYQAWKQVANELRIYFDESINNRLRGVSRMESFEIILERYDGVMEEANKTRYTSKKNEIYKELPPNMSPSDLSSEVKETLGKLRENGLRLAIDSPSENACFTLERLGLGGYSDAISDGNQTACSKPDPEVFLLTARLIGGEPEYCLVVEDAKAGLVVAKVGGMNAAGIGDASGYGLADYRLMTFEEFLAACSCEPIQNMLYQNRGRKQRKAVTGRGIRFRDGE